MSGRRRVENIEGKRRARAFDLSLLFVLLGTVAGVVGAGIGLLPFLQRRAPCFGLLSPPSDFDASGATGPSLSMFPFGAHCTYFSSATGETIVSTASPWPSIMLLVGLALIILGAVGIVRGLRPTARRT